MNTTVHSSRVEEYGRIHDGSIVRVIQSTAGKLGKVAHLVQDNPTRRTLLKVLATHDGGIGYADLCSYLPVSERWVRELVADLRNAGIVETPGNPALIQFTSDDMMIAVKELLAFLSADWAELAAKGAKTALRTLSPTTDDHHFKQYLQTMSKLLRGRRG